MSRVPPLRLLDDAQRRVDGAVAVHYAQPRDLGVERALELQPVGGDQVSKIGDRRHFVDGITGFAPLLRVRPLGGPAIARANPLVS